MTCVHCRATVIEGAKFCANCGKPTASGCPHCGATLEPRAKFCKDCGRSLQIGAAASVVGWWGPPRGATQLDTAFRLRVILLSVGAVIDLPYLLAPLKLAGLGAGIYLLTRGNRKRGLALVVGFVPAVVVSIILALVFRSR